MADEFKGGVPAMTMDWKTWGIEAGSSVDEAVIALVQQHLGVNLPPLYLDLVSYADEASPEWSTFDYGGQQTCISEFFKFTAQAEPYSLLWYATGQRVARLAPGLIPIARDAGDQLVCLNTTGAAITVALFAPDSGHTYPVAADFQQFVEQWRP